ncbi:MULTISPECIES: hypothetical protein [Methylocaldum]|jgi:hypothetical protein|uniref:hypothetical protein n=1 Tax=unclassified Methylocaldum TaxID=2622260 RepID=UPI00098B15E3|nr:hypothetical protein [Methylocaldum sp. 14B]MDV3240576.1 hypothetical protein [Methylocaldum sp.]MVF20032.1 hypothetical protein [Methylocaldum sp. BRCS4]
MTVASGFFVDWAGNARRTEEPGGGYRCEVDTVARYVAVLSQKGTLIHEGTFYKTLADMEAAGIKAKLVDASVPW